MTLKKKKSSESAAQRAEAIKTALRDLAKEAAKTKAQREKMANYADVSLSTIQRFLYRGEGSYTIFINIFLYLFRLDERDVLKNLREFPRFEVESRESDKIWKELSSQLTEEERIYGLNMLKHAIRLKRQ